MKLHDIKKNAQAVFKQNKDVKTLYATEDGQLFVEKAKTNCENHANKVGGTVRQKKLKIYVLKRDEILKMKFKEDKKKIDPVNTDLEETTNTDSENTITDPEETQNTNSETENTNSDEPKKTDSETEKKIVFNL